MKESARESIQEIDSFILIFACFSDSVYEGAAATLPANNNAKESI